MSIIHIPSPTKGSFISANCPKENFHESDSLFVGTSSQEPAATYRTLLKFDTKAVPKDYSISSATLELYVKRNDYACEPKTIDIHLLTESFEEKEVTWKDQPKYNPNVEASLEICKEYASFVSWDITSLFREWQTNKVKNKGIIIKAWDEDLGTLLAFESNKSPYIERRPKIKVRILKESMHSPDSPNFFSNVQRNLTSSNCFQFSKSYNISKASFNTFFVQNKGCNPATLVVQISPDNTTSTWQNDSMVSVVNPGENFAITTNHRANWSRLAFRSTNPEKSTTLDIWIQTET